MLQINTLSRLDLGVKDENLARDLYIDMNAWFTDYPNATFSIWHKRNGDETKYAASGVTFDRGSGILKWTPDAYDTFYIGKGLAEIRCTENDVIKKTKDIVTEVARSLVLGSGETLAAGWQNFLNAVESAKNGAEQAQEAAEEAQAAAETAQTAAQTAAANAETQANRAARERQNAENAAGEAQMGAADASAAAQRSSGYATEAKQAKLAAEAQATLAEGYAGDAETSATAAEAAANSILNASARASTLAPGSQATAVIVTEEGAKVFVFGIPQGAKGDTGAKGEKGDAFEVYSTYASIAAMEADAANVPFGKFVMISSTVEDPDNAKLYVRTDIGFGFITDFSGAQGIKGDTGNGIASAVLNQDYTLTLTFTDGSTYTTGSIRGATGATGNGIASVALNPNYTLTITYTDGTSYTTSSIRGAKGADGQDGQDGQDGHTPVKGTDYWTAADKAEIAQEAAELVIDDTAGTGDTGVTWSADKLTDVQLAVTNNASSISDLNQALRQIGLNIENGILVIDPVTDVA